MVTTADIRTILVEGRTLPGVESLEDDAELLIDSFSLAWLQHSLRTDHGVELDLRDVRAESFSSLNRIRDHINELAKSRNSH